MGAAACSLRLFVPQSLSEYPAYLCPVSVAQPPCTTDTHLLPQDRRVYILWGQTLRM